MRKFILVVIVMILVLGFGNNAAHAQTTFHPETTVHHGRSDQGILFQGFSENAGVLLVNFEIPYGGVVLFSLFDASGKKVWQKQGPLDRGVNQYAMRRSAFRAGEHYTFTLRYKLSEVTGIVPTNP